MQITVEEYEKMRAENECLRSELRLMNEKVKYLMGKLFGTKSEKLHPDQLSLPFDEKALPVLPAEAEEALENEEVQRPRKVAKRKPLAERLQILFPHREARCHGVAAEAEQDVGAGGDALVQVEALHAAAAALALAVLIY